MTLYAFDGTWNSASLDDNLEQENETNVANFSEAYADESKWYVPGPGTRYGKVGHVLGGAAGMGGIQRVTEAYNQFCKDWEAGNTTIDIVGFSRGAALALDFANRIKGMVSTAPVRHPQPPRGSRFDFSVYGTSSVRSGFHSI